MKIINRYKWNRPTTIAQRSLDGMVHMPERIGKPLLFLALIIGTLSGCNEKTIAPAVAKKSQFSPVFGAIAQSNPNNTIPDSEMQLGSLAFLNRDHFACLKIPLAELKSMKELQEVPWKDLDGSLKRLVGDGQNLGAIKNLYVVLDGQFLKIEDFESCVGYLIEFSENVDPTNQKGSALNTKENNKTQRRVLSDKLIAYGPQPIVEKLNDDDSNSSEIAARLLDSNTEGAISCAISLRPIRSTLKGIFSMVATMQPAMKSLAHIPDDIESIWFSLDITNSQDFINLQMDILNDELKKQIFESLDQAIANSSDISQFTNSMPGSSESMINSETPNSLLEMFKEISENSLFSTNVSGQQLNVKILRPKKTDELISNIISDYAKQSAFQQRLEGAQEIANALKSYFEKHGVLPPMGRVEFAEATNQLPAQFNWRVGLLQSSDHVELYKQFDFQKKWDDDSNLEVANRLKSLIPLDTFVLSAGPNRLYENLKSRPNLQTKDNKNWTAIAVETNQPDKTWSKSWSRFSDTDLAQIGKTDENGIIVITAKFEVRVLKRSSGKLEAILSTDSGESLRSRDFFKFSINKP